MWCNSLYSFREQKTFHKIYETTYWLRKWWTSDLLLHHCSRLRMCKLPLLTFSVAPASAHCRTWAHSEHVTFSSMTVLIDLHKHVLFILLHIKRKQPISGFSCQSCQRKNMDICSNKAFTGKKHKMNNRNYILLLLYILIYWFFEL